MRDRLDTERMRGGMNTVAMATSLSLPLCDGSVGRGERDWDRALDLQREWDRALGLQRDWDRALGLQRDWDRALGLQRDWDRALGLQRDCVSPERGSGTGPSSGWDDFHVLVDRRETCAVRNRARGVRP
ncbi:unnamed protein product [Gadus morhua 'NCC']